jgi:hypothetical protein
MTFSQDSVCQIGRFRVSRTGILCVKNDGFVCQEQGFCVSEIGVSCVAVYNVSLKLVRQRTYTNS